MARGTFQLTLALWAVLYAASFAVFWLVDPTGDSFTRGLNRVGWFLFLQLIAALVAIVLWTFAQRLTRGSVLRWVARAPALLALLLIAAIAVLYVYGNMSRTDPDAAPAPKPPTTAPITGPIAPGN